jgi:hypothetical protein
VWRLLDVDDPLRPRVRAAIADIADALAADPLDHLPVGLADGLAGVALFFGYLAHVEPRRFGHHAATADRILERAGEDLDGSLAGLSLFHGFPGVAWVGDHLRALRGEPDFELNHEVDDAIIEQLSSEIVLPFELAIGLVGLGVYARERAGHPPADRCLEMVLYHLARYARPEPEGVSFWTHSAWQSTARDEYPAGCWNLGLAHGQPGVVAFLADAAHAHGPAARLARQVLPRATAWLLSRRRGDDAPTCFAAREAPDAPAQPARSGWCFGDAGVALAVAAAGRVADATSIARCAVRRPFDATGVHDGTFCHGAAGLAQLYARLGEVTGDTTLRAETRSWLERVLDMRDMRLGLGGFYTATPDGPRSQHAFLDGVAGIGLVLLSALASTAAWDRFVLLSQRPA